MRTLVLVSFVFLAGCSLARAQMGDYQRTFDILKDQDVVNNERSISGLSRNTNRAGISSGLLLPSSPTGRPPVGTRRTTVTTTNTGTTSPRTRTRAQKTDRSPASIPTQTKSADGLLKPQIFSAPQANLPTGAEEAKPDRTSSRRTPSSETIPRRTTATQTTLLLPSRP